MSEQPAFERPKVILVMRSIVRNTDGRILIVQRAADDNHNPNMWEFPGGKLEQGQDVSDALNRELEEEIGLQVIVDQQVAYFESRFLSKGKYAGSSYLVLIGTSRVENSAVTLSFEHQDHKWVTTQEVLEYDLTPESRNALVNLTKLLES